MLVMKCAVKGKVGQYLVMECKDIGKYFLKIGVKTKMKKIKSIMGK